MRRAEALQRLRQALPDLRREFGVIRAGLFGSVARDEAREGSDVDVVVDVNPALSFAGWDDLKSRLEGVFGESVDVCASNALHPLVRTRALAEAVYADA